TVRAPSVRSSSAAARAGAARRAAKRSPPCFPRRTSFPPSPTERRRRAPATAARVAISSTFHFCTRSLLCDQATARGRTYHGRQAEGCGMKGNAKLLEALNEILTGELTAVNQYFIHAKMCDNWGYERLAHKNREESISEMKHADELIERILFLEGVPNMQRLDKVRVGETVSEQLKLDLGLEQVAIPRFNKAIALAVDVGDNTTRELLEDMLTSEEDHVNLLGPPPALITQL